MLYLWSFSQSSEELFRTALASFGILKNLFFPLGSVIVRVAGWSRANWISFGAHLLLHLIVVFPPFHQGGAQVQEKLNWIAFVGDWTFFSGQLRGNAKDFIPIPRVEQLNQYDPWLLVRWRLGSRGAMGSLDDQLLLEVFCSESCGYPVEKKVDRTFPLASFL